MNELLLINKDKNYTSRDVVNIISKKFNTKKVGHFGTLDPLATGLLVIGIGKYTKIQKLFPKEDKTYEVEVLVGTSTTTYDITGKIVCNKEIIVNKYYLINSLLSFEKTYMQEVPIYSAVKVNGKRLYEYARNNEEVILPKKEVTIYDIYDIYMKSENNYSYLCFTIKVSKGFYIRSFINDLSKVTNIPMCMSNLKRIKIDDFDIKKSYTIEDIKNDNYKFCDINSILNYKKVEVDDILEKKVLNGCIIDNIYNEDIVLFTKNNKLLVAYKVYEKDSKKMKPLFLF